ncbi:MAG: D-alanine--D-alanine ligase [Planctomycetota bacterium]
MIPLAVLCGGPSLEHEISLRTGHEVLEHLDRTRFAPIAVRIEKNGDWNVDGEAVGDALAGVQALRDRGIDTCFLALHGPFGEDGRVQAFLETSRLRYTGSGPTACAVSGDKIHAKRIAATHGIRMADDLLVPPGRVDEIESRLGYPCVVKDPVQGSTLGMEITADRDALTGAIERLGKHCDRLLVERSVPGREFTVAVLDLPPDGPRVLPLVEIVARDGYFDFEEKYSESGAEEICPAPIEGPAAERMSAWALTAHIAFGMRQMSRTDFRLPPEGDPVFLETNSIPGLTARSLYPMAAAEAGISFPELLTRLIDDARR